MSISADHITSGYSKEVDILHDVSIRAAKSKITGIIGPNGSGKSTLLKTIYGFLKPKGGRIFLNDEDITGCNPHLTIRKGISYVPQNGALFPNLSVSDNLQLGGWIYRGNKDLLKTAITKVYETYPNLNDKKNLAASSLSGGERKMLRLARP